MPTIALGRSRTRLGLLLLIAFALAVLPVLTGEHHAATHEAQFSFDHTHLADLEPCTQDHAVDGDCAAISNCPVCVVRHHDADAGFALATPGSVYPRTGPEAGQSPAPDIQPPRSSVAV
jgi:hypothetical protein